MADKIILDARPVEFRKHADASDAARMGQATVSCRAGYRMCDGMRRGGANSARSARRGRVIAAFDVRLCEADY